MMELIFTQEDLHDPITSEDEAFASKLSKEYKLSFEDISMLLREFRYSVQDGLPEYLFDDLENGGIKKRYEQILINRLLKSITIETENGSLIINSSDPFFKYFSLPIQRAIKKIERLVNSEKEKMKSVLMNFVFLDVYMYLRRNNSLSKFKIYVILGLFLVHFKVYKGKALLTEKEYKPEDYEAQDYEHYLYDRVKSRLKNFSNRFRAK
jgi:hypothetical protein